jgi:hypothetical protein
MCLISQVELFMAVHLVRLLLFDAVFISEQLLKLILNRVFTEMFVVLNGSAATSESRINRSSILICATETFENIISTAATDIQLPVEDFSFTYCDAKVDESAL